MIHAQDPGFLDEVDYSLATDQLLLEDGEQVMQRLCELSCQMQAPQFRDNAAFQSFL